MKKTLTFLILFFFSQIGYSQTACNLYKTNTLIWYGLDFTKTKLVGAGFNNPYNIKESFFPAWNNLIIAEPQKFTLKKFFHKETILFNLSLVNTKNRSANENTMVTMNSTEITPLNEADISTIVKSYDFDKKEGVGVLMIVETFNKFAEEGTFYIAFIDLSTKSVILTKKVTGHAVGAGLRNYWAGAILNALKQCDKEFDQWKNEANCN